ncbi:TetR/AcrR family transcriptional regulator [Methylobacterium trifolii]|uniref:HTH tetR-type domain-containing protein n=1 Tax=Methylobacterium trifolii TaxID=1003092 RepID=A0ABQ4U593_9HYPH|nr:TetR/AcrR family transcriptional regulator [Methylobacterium trifolii]GJE62007.1 hypothetical protein MPOCJGCO_4135 [Methylobacterium trifolii]
MALSTSGSAERYHHGDLRNALVEAASRLLRAGGREAVSLREAARAAGVSHNAPYRHFPSRDALLAAVAAAGFRLLRDQLEATDRRPVALGRAYLAFAGEDRARFQLMFGQSPAKDAFPDLAEAAGAALAVLDRAVGGPAAPDRVSAATLRAWGLVHGLAHLVAEGQVSEAVAEAALGDEGEARR